MEMIPCHVSDSVSQSLVLPIPVGEMNQGDGSLIRDDSNAEGSQTSLYHAGNLYIALYGATAATPVGQFVVHYTVDLISSVSAGDTDTTSLKVVIDAAGAIESTQVIRKGMFAGTDITDLYAAPNDAVFEVTTPYPCAALVKYETGTTAVELVDGAAPALDHVYASADYGLNTYWIPRGGTHTFTIRGAVAGDAGTYLVQFLHAGKDYNFFRD
jgi:hypothetical protein